MTDINEATTLAATSSADSKTSIMHNNENSRHLSSLSEQEETDITESRPNPGHSEGDNTRKLAVSPTPLEPEQRGRLSIEDSASEEDVTDEHSNNTPLSVGTNDVEQRSTAGFPSTTEDSNPTNASEEETKPEESQEQSPQQIPSADSNHTNDSFNTERQSSEDQTEQSLPTIVTPEPIHQLGLGPTDTHSLEASSPATTASSAATTNYHAGGARSGSRGRSVSNVTPSTFYSGHHSSINSSSDSYSTPTAQSTTSTLPPRSQRVWEMDRQAPECRRCNRKFNFLVRRHHCRRCGQIVCDKCSSNRLRLPVEELIEDPMISLSQYPLLASQSQRVCDTCYREPIRRSSESSTFYYSADGSHRKRGYYGNPSRSRTVPSMRHQQQQQEMQRTDSSQSLMIDCPVCGNSFLGMHKAEQESHLKQCLNVGSPPVHAPRYIVYKLKDGSTQIGDECPICFDEFEEGDKIARMICLCSYHQRCLSSWLQRGKGCPVHYDSLRI